VSLVGIGSVEDERGQGRRADDGGLQRPLLRSADDVWKVEKEPSDVNTKLDGSTYRRWKISHFGLQINVLRGGKLEQANIREKWRHLQLLDPH